MRTRSFRVLGPVSEVGYGLWGMGGWSGSNDDESVAALEKSVELGCTFFDTAWGYGAGHSERLLAFHICDWLVPTTDLLLDRGMMGDGVIDIPLIRSWMESAGYRGAHEVEIFSAGNWWKKDPDEVLITCIERHRTVC